MPFRKRITVRWGDYFVTVSWTRLRGGYYAFAQTSDQTIVARSESYPGRGGMKAALKDLRAQLGMEEEI